MRAPVTPVPVHGGLPGGLKRLEARSGLGSQAAGEDTSPCQRTPLRSWLRWHNRGRYFSGTRSISRSDPSHPLSQSSLHADFVCSIYSIASSLLLQRALERHTDSCRLFALKSLSFIELRRQASSNRWAYTLRPNICARLVSTFDHFPALLWWDKCICDRRSCLPHKLIFQSIVWRAYFRLPHRPITRLMPNGYVVQS